MTRFGDFSLLCTRTPSYPWCNLFYRQLSKHAPHVLRGLSADSHTAPVGINPECGILRAGTDGSHANIANIIACALSFVIVQVLVCRMDKRTDGSIGPQVVLRSYSSTLFWQLFSTGSFLTQGSTAIVVLTALHATQVVMLFWALLACALVEAQFVEDRNWRFTMANALFSLSIFTLTLYISLDVALSITGTFGPFDPPQALNSIPLFVLTTLFPAVTAFFYFVTIIYTSLYVLKVYRAMWYFMFSMALFIISQLVYFPLNKVICKASNAKVDGSFVATLLETACVGVLYLAWCDYYQKKILRQYMSFYMNLLINGRSLQ